MSRYSRERLAQDIAACRSMLRGNSKTFFVASLLLPRTVREPASALYAFCRVADDAVDMDVSGNRRDQLAAVDDLRSRLAQVYAGAPRDCPADRAFAGIVEKYDIPRALPEALIEGFEWDASGRRYQDIGALEEYAARVAATVGAMMAILMRTRDPQALARACDLGAAMQLSNIARDVGEDARLGRIYLPIDALESRGLDVEAWLANPTPNAAVRETVRDLLRHADMLYARALCGISSLPAACQPGIHAAGLLYAEIGAEVARRDFDSVTTRAVVPAAVKAKLLMRAIATTPNADALDVAPLRACQFLVDAAASTEHAYTDLLHEVEWWNVQARLVWLVAFLERMERRDRSGRDSAELSPS